MPGRPKKPIALKKMQGTYRKDRDLPTEQAEKVCQKIETKPLKVSKDITDPVVRKAYKRHIELLRQIGHEVDADSQVLENAYKNLELARFWFSQLDPTSEDYDIILTRYHRCEKAYEDIVKQFFLTPQSRIRLVLDTQQMHQNDLQIKKEEGSAIAKLLSKKES